MDPEDFPPVPPHSKVRLVSIETPYSAPTEEGVKTNLAYARQCMSHSIIQGESPFVSHLLFTQVLDDTVRAERLLGLLLSHAWRLHADAIVLYIDRGISPGMKDAEALGQEHGITVEHRRLHDG